MVLSARRADGALVTNLAHTINICEPAKSDTVHYEVTGAMMSLELLSSRGWRMPPYSASEVTITHSSHRGFGIFYHA